MQSQTPTPVPPNYPMAVQLEAQQWNQVIASLADAPWRVAAPLIESITSQLSALTRQQDQVPAAPSPVGNGLSSSPMPPMEIVSDVTKENEHG
jgi:hypothetical protein